MLKQHGCCVSEANPQGRQDAAAQDVRYLFAQDARREAQTQVHTAGLALPAEDKAPHT